MPTTTIIYQEVLSIVEYEAISYSDFNKTTAESTENYNIFFSHTTGAWEGVHLRNALALVGPPLDLLLTHPKGFQKLKFECQSSIP